MYFVSCIVCHFSPPWLILLTRWMRQVLLKRRYTFTALHRVISRKFFTFKVITIFALYCRHKPVFWILTQVLPVRPDGIVWISAPGCGEWPNSSSPPSPHTHTHTLPRCFAPWEKAPGILWIRSWVGPKTEMSAMEREKLLQLGRGPRLSITMCLSYPRVKGGGI